MTRRSQGSGSGSVSVSIPKVKMARTPKAKPTPRIKVEDVDMDANGPDGPNGGPPPPHDDDDDDDVMLPTPPLVDDPSSSEVNMKKRGMDRFIQEPDVEAYVAKMVADSRAEADKEVYVAKMRQLSSDQNLERANADLENMKEQVLSMHAELRKVKVEEASRKSQGSRVERGGKRETAVFDVVIINASLRIQNMSQDITKLKEEIKGQEEHIDHLTEMNVKLAADQRAFDEEDEDFSVEDMSVVRTTIDKIFDSLMTKSHIDMDNIVGKVHSLHISKPAARY